MGNAVSPLGFHGFAPGPAEADGTDGVEGFLRDADREARARHHAPQTEPGGENLRRIYARGLEFIHADLSDVFEQAIAYFLFAALQQFYFDGNKRTARYMMNGHLMSQGIDAISVPAARRQEFNSSMVEFFRTREGTGMFRFLASCRAEADRGVLPGDNG